MRLRNPWGTRGIAYSGAKKIVVRNRPEFDIELSDLFKVTYRQLFDAWLTMLTISKKPLGVAKAAYEPLKLLRDHDVANWPDNKKFENNLSVVRRYKSGDQLSENDGVLSNDEGKAHSLEDISKTDPVIKSRIKNALHEIQKHYNRSKQKIALIKKDYGLD